MSRARIYAKNLLANWVGYAANLAVTFFLTPFVVHTLGEVQYGVWALMMSLTGYLGLVELGTRRSVGRFINYYLGKEDMNSVNAIMSTALAIFLGVGGILLVGGTLLAAGLPHIFTKIPPALVPSARIIVILIALNLWLGFLSAPFRQVLQAHDRFELTNAVDVVVLALRTGGTIWALLSGYGLATLALVHLASNVVAHVGVQILARRVFPALSLHPALISRERVRELFAFSIWAFVGAMAWNLLYAADAIVIAILLGPKWVTYYAVGAMLLYRALEFIGRATSIFSPRIMQDCAREDWGAVQRHFRRGSNLAMGIGILLLVGMIGFGREFIILWMGPSFEISYSILAILASSSLFLAAVSIAYPVYYGLYRVRLASSLAVAQGLANIGLTLLFVLVFKQGIQGVAWGTFFPRIVFSVLVGLIAMRLIGIQLRQFALNDIARWATLGMLFYGVCLTVNLLPLRAVWTAFFLKVALSSMAYSALLWFILLDAEGKTWVRCTVAKRIPLFSGKAAP